MLHIDEGRQRELRELDTIDVPGVAPWARTRGGGTRWKPIQHGVLARAVLRTAEVHGLTVREAKWATNPSETDLFGAIVFGRAAEHRVPKGLELAMSLRHSNAGRYAVTFGFGAQVMVCTNGMLTGEHIVARKHTHQLRVEELVTEGFARFVASAREVGAQVRRLRRQRLSNLAADHLIVEAGRQRTLPWSQLGKVEAAWRQPDEAAFRGRNAWSLYNAFTGVARTRSPAGQLTTLRKIAPLFEPKALRKLSA